MVFHVGYLAEFLSGLKRNIEVAAGKLTKMAATIGRSASSLEKSGDVEKLKVTK
jgi:hypothetical protein